MTSLLDPFSLGSIGLSVIEATRLSPDSFTALQRSRLARLLRCAVSRSAYYRETLRGVDPDRVPLAHLPVTHKRELMARFDDWVTDPQLRLPALRRFVADPEAVGDDHLGRYVVWESSGSTGEPGLFVQDARAMAVYDSLEALRRCPARPWQRLFDPLFLGERTAFVGATGGHFASFASVQRLRRLNPWLAAVLRSFSILQPQRELFRELEAFDPTVIATYPTAAALLADEVRRGTLRLAPREVWTGGEALTEPVRELLHEVFGCSVRNSYGASEFLSIGWECSHGRMHLNSDWALLEPVDRDHRPVPPGTVPATTLLTNLANEVQPLIRYDLGDEVTFHPDRCPCGCLLPTIDVSGRHDEALVMRSREGRRVTLLPLALVTALEDEAHVFDFQLRQRDDRTLVLRLAPEVALDDAAMPRCRRVLTDFARRQGVDSLKLIEELGLPLQRSRSGKLMRVIAASSRARRSIDAPRA